MSCAWKEDKCRIGLILGTGTNACYLENIDAIQTVDSDIGCDNQMIVNTEWGYVCTLSMFYKQRL